MAVVFLALIDFFPETKILFKNLFRITTKIQHYLRLYSEFLQLFSNKKKHKFNVGKVEKWRFVVGANSVLHFIIFLSKKGQPEKKQVKFNKNEYFIEIVFTRYRNKS